MSLRALAQVIIASRRDGQYTPVLVVDPCLAIQRSFVLALCDQLIAVDRDIAFKHVGWQETRSIRFDWIRHASGFWSILSDPIARRWADHVAAGASRLCKLPVQFQVTAAISRPSLPQHELVIGLCDNRQPLLPWTCPIRLTASPEPVADLQLQTP